MRFLLDMMMSPRLAEWLGTKGHDAVHAADLGLDMAADTELLDRAAEDDRVVVTADLDFPMLLAIHGAEVPAVILFRGGGSSGHTVRKRFESLLDSVSEADIVASITVVEPYRIRRRPLPL